MEMRRSETSERPWRRRLLEGKPQTAGEINESLSLINFPQVFDSRHSKDSAVRHYGLRLRMMNPEKPFVTMAAVRGIQGS